MNTEITRAGAYDRNMDSLNSVRAVAVSDAKIVENYLAVDRGEWVDLPPTEKVRIQTYFEMMFGVYEKTYFARKYGHIGDSEWTRFGRFLCLHRNRVALNEGMTEAMRLVMTVEFYDYMIDQCPLDEVK